MVLKAFVESIENTKLCPANRSILIALCSLFAVHGIIQYTGEFTMLIESVQYWLRALGVPVEPCKAEKLVQSNATFWYIHCQTGQ